MNLINDMSASLSFLICGLEHSGTTMVSDLFREHPDVDSGFECGVLLCEKPRDFLSYEPFCNHMVVGWGIDHRDFEMACDASTFEEFYSRLFLYSSLIKEKQAGNIFDKTPRYITDLGRVQQRCDRPIIAVIKDPRSLALSDFKRSKYSIDQIDQWYEGWMEPKKAYMRSAYLGYQYAWRNDNCFVVRLEDICFDARNTVGALYDFVGIDFKSEFLSLRSKRFNNTSGSSISVGACMQFLDDLPVFIQERILEDFSEFDRWFFPF